MNINFLELYNYGIFVWTSFAITLFLCAKVYLRTRKTLKKYEKDFATELNQLSNTKKKIVLENSKIANQILFSDNKII